MDLFRRYGALAATGDRHLAEFLPRTWYLASPETAHNWHFSLTPVSYREQNQAQKEAEGAAMTSGAPPVTRAPS